MFVCCGRPICIKISKNNPKLILNYLFVSILNLYLQHLGSESPRFKSSELGVISAILIGDVDASGTNLVLVANVEQQIHIFDASDGGDYRDS